MDLVRGVLALLGLILISSALGYGLGYINSKYEEPHDEL